MTNISNLGFGQNWVFENILLFYVKEYSLGGKKFWNMLYWARVNITCHIIQYKAPPSYFIKVHQIPSNIHCISAQIPRDRWISTNCHGIESFEGFVFFSDSSLLSFLWPPSLFGEILKVAEILHLRTNFQFLCLHYQGEELHKDSFDMVSISLPERVDSCNSEHFVRSLFSAAGCHIYSIVYNIYPTKYSWDHSEQKLETFFTKSFGRGLSVNGMETKQAKLSDSFLVSGREKTNKQFRKVFSLHFDPDILGFFSIWQLLSSALITSNSFSVWKKTKRYFLRFFLNKSWPSRLNPSKLLCHVSLCTDWAEEWKRSSGWATNQPARLKATFLSFDVWSNSLWRDFAFPQ